VNLRDLEDNYLSISKFSLGIHFLYGSVIFHSLKINGIKGFYKNYSRCFFHFLAKLFMS